MAMAGTWTLMLIAFIVMLAEYGVEPLHMSNLEKKPHAALGMTALALAFIQPFMAALRWQKLCRISLR